MYSSRRRFVRLRTEIRFLFALKIVRNVCVPGKSPMASVQEYRKFADKCRRWATEAEPEEDKELFLQMARD
jgi:hypothetical protein